MGDKSEDTGVLFECECETGTMRILETRKGRKDPVDYGTDPGSKLA